MKMSEEKKKNLTSELLRLKLMQTLTPQQKLRVQFLQQILFGVD